MAATRIAEGRLLMGTRRMGAERAAKRLVAGEAAMGAVGMGAAGGAVMEVKVGCSRSPTTSRRSQLCKCVEVTVVLMEVTAAAKAAARPVLMAAAEAAAMPVLSAIAVTKGLCTSLCGSVRYYL
jgi:hypothetical protein